MGLPDWCLVAKYQSAAPQRKSCLGIRSPVMFQVSLLQNQYASDEFSQACTLGQTNRKKSLLFVKSCAFIVSFARQFERSGSSLIFLNFVTKPLRMPSSYGRNVANKPQLLLFWYWSNGDIFMFYSLTLYYFPEIQRMHF